MSEAGAGSEPITLEQYSVEFVEGRTVVQDWVGEVRVSTAFLTGPALTANATVAADRLRGIERMRLAEPVPLPEASSRERS